MNPDHVHLWHAGQDLNKSTLVSQRVFLVDSISYQCIWGVNAGPGSLLNPTRLRPHGDASGS